MVPPVGQGMDSPVSEELLINAGGVGGLVSG